MAIGQEKVPGVREESKRRREVWGIFSLAWIFSKKDEDVPPSMSVDWKGEGKVKDGARLISCDGSALLII